MNVRDSEVVSGLLKNTGYQFVDKFEKADIIIFNTCSVRQHAEDKVWSEIGRISKLCKKEKNLKGSPQKAGTVPIIGLIGCMAQNYKETAFERSPEIDFVVGPSDIDKIPEIIHDLVISKLQAPGSRPDAKRGHSPKNRDSPLFERKIWETDGEFRPEEIYHTGFYEDKEHAYVVISEGCSNYCSYCVVPYVRGSIHHRYYKDIIKEIEEAIEKGLNKITLLGQNVNAYSQPGESFIELLKKVNDIKGLKEFDFITSHPKDTSIELFKVMSGLDKLNKRLHLPIQSGSNRILKMMNRGYAREYYLDLVQDYRKIIKDGILTTDIIVGFPTEAAEDFKETFNLVREVRFNCAYIFKYSPRPGTQAASLADDISREEKEKRHALILKLQKEISRKINKK
ncbi:MAG: MiaB/RimO family radical SAM methylthiotransferase [Candidatus Omnitrophica bacterium]|nr:MiaB/RimO family radical SAM methylthiotransferase [Candidatus Omnitrophota bacterium]MBU1929816.1 MiaB/RimO family radical SAM methylthiotransferase [Candidatus Omnitrophota bacterium]MBU2035182.1 MiaB/RimO family radical SAM methylthiotransferase [Candidatus Omnitrophota bacterium]MBU2221338.1 MiaB/RimO family radical SAM methylthiotransferase [Candidatus Omnitrophota bacterium]